MNDNKELMTAALAAVQDKLKGTLLEGRVERVSNEAEEPYGWRVRFIVQYSCTVESSDYRFERTENKAALLADKIEELDSAVECIRQTFRSAAEGRAGWPQ